MADVIKRKCTKCKGEIEINRGNIKDVVAYQGKYYHSSCFEALATQRASSKRGNTEQWQEALDNIWELEAKTRKTLERFWAKDDLNAWLLDHYDVAVVPTYFWQVIADLESGKYKQQKCKPIPVDILHKMWIWGQKRLDGINSKNKINHTGPKNDSDRLRYDLAILISHVGDYIKYTSRTKEEAAEIKSRVESTSKLNCEHIYTSPQKSQGDSDILNIMDDIF